MTQESPAQLDAAAAILIRAQQFMMAAGYRYTQASAGFWPLCVVEMTKQEWTQLIAPFVPGQMQAVQESWSKLAQEKGLNPGLLLVGELPVDHAEVRAFLDANRGAMGYVDARGGQFILRRGSLLASPPRVLRSSNLKEILHPRGNEPYLQTDCRQQMQKDLVESRQVEEFIERAHVMAGKPRYRLTDVIIYACIAVYALMILYGGHMPNSAYTPTPQVLRAYGALYGVDVAHGQYWRLITCSFLHASVVHLIFNMLAMFYFGRPLEIFQGVRRVALFYFFSVFTASLASLWWRPLGFGVGASGGLFGLLGVMLGMLIRHRAEIPVMVRKDLRRWLLSILIYNGIWLLLPHLAANLDNAAHAGGFVGGLAISLALSRSPSTRQPQPRWAYVATAAMLGATLAFGVITMNKVRSAAHTVDQAPAAVQPSDARSR